MGILKKQKLGFFTLLALTILLCWSVNMQQASAANITKFQNSPKQASQTEGNKITGTITKGGVAIESGDLTFYKSGPSKDYYIGGIKDGTFSVNLPDGDYIVKDYYDYRNDRSEIISYTFKVTNGKSNPSTLSINIPKDNVVGFIQKDGKKIENGRFNIVFENGESYRIPIYKGQYSVYLPDGTYRVESYYDEKIKRNIETEYEFKVTNGKTSSTPFNINLPDDNVQGIVKNNGAKVGDGEITFLEKGGSNKSFSIKLTNGEFKAYLPNGAYYAKEYYDETKNETILLDYSFKVTNGKSTPASLVIEVPQDNVKGTVTRGGENVKEGYIRYVQEGNGKFYEINIKDGQFSEYLPNGTYRSDGYYDTREEQFIDVESSFTIVSGKAEALLIKIDVPKDNVTGSIQKGGAKVKNGYVNFYNEENTKSYKISIRDDQFSTYLADGSYKVTGYFDSELETYFDKEYSFNVTNGKSNPSPLLIDIPKDNVIGVIKKDGEKVASGNIDFYKDGQKKATYEAHIKDGQFSTYLPDGAYKTNSYYDNYKGQCVFKEYEFKVVNGKTTPSTLVIDIPKNNVTGTIYKDDLKVGSGSVEIKEDGKKDNVYYFPIEDGKFNTYLPDGSYTIESYKEFWGNRSYFVYYKFKVQDGKTNPASLSVTTPKENVKGFIQRDGKKIDEGAVTFYEEGNKDNEFTILIRNGEFSAYLPDGKYQMDHYYEYGFEVEETFPYDYSFSVVNGKSNPSFLAIDTSITDKTAPAAPKVNMVSDKDKVITGTAEPEATVTVKAANKTYTDVTKADGKFAVTIDAQKAGTELSVTAKDKAGNISEPTKVSVQDKTAPVAPKVNGVSDKDKVITGTAEPEATVIVKAGNKTYTSVTKTDGKFIVAIDAQKAGTVLSVTAKDKAGNISKATTVTVQDKTAPPAPVVNKVTTNDTKVTGTAEANSIVYVKVGTKVIGEKAADSKGTFTVPIAKQKANTKIGVVVKDKAGNYSPSTFVTVAETDKVPPSSPKVNAVSDKDKVVTGTAEVNATVTVKIGNKTYTSVTKADGKFTVAIDAQKPGTVLSVTAKDKAGNISKATTVTVQDKTAPPAPVVNKVTTNDTKVTGTAEVNSMVYVKVGTKVIGEKAADSKGTFTVPIAKQKANTKIGVAAKDKAGNYSPYTYIIVTAADTVKPVITGATNKTVKVNSTFNSKAGVTATDNVDGNLTNSIQVSGSVNTKKKGIYTLTYSVLDKSGNKAVVTRKITVN
ncbi:Ig-like domain-containing protein [Priestia megaterium]|uniref:Ig-like domain-containing protein n=1 Tax=Priestia megaterium TaxID=1404 RepID=UPI003242004B